QPLAAMLVVPERRLPLQRVQVPDPPHGVVGPDRLDEAIMCQLEPGGAPTLLGPDQVRILEHPHNQSLRVAAGTLQYLSPEPLFGDQVTVEPLPYGPLAW